MSWLLSQIDRWDRWMLRWYGVTPERIAFEKALRSDLLRRILPAVGIGAVLYLAAGFAGLFSGRLFPWDGIELLVGVLISHVLLRLDRANRSAVVFMVILGHFTAFAIAQFGMNGPSPVLLVLTVPICGLLVGRYYLKTWAILCAVVLTFITLMEKTDQSMRQRSLQLGIWLGAIAICCWLIYLFSRRLEEFLEQSRREEELRQEAVWAERTRMARDIHDTLAQGFTGIVMQLQAADEITERDPSLARKHLATARELARSSLAEARRSVLALRPEVLERVSLERALREIAEQTIDGRHCCFEFSIQGSAVPMDAELEKALLHIGKEALTNSARHASAKTIRAQLNFAAGSVKLEIADDGAGILEARRFAGMGLSGMQERAKKLGGTLDIESAPGAGTRIVAEFPIGVKP